MSGLLIRGAEIEPARVVDVRIVNGCIGEIETRLAPESGEDVVEARGGALLAGLHDHHIHLFALAAAKTSVVCGPPAVADREGLARALGQARAEQGWIRGIGYHESVAGDLDRAQLDTLAAKDIAIRIQHRTGAMWILNSAAIDALDLSGEVLPEGFECDAKGDPTRRVYDQDAWLRGRLGAKGVPDLSTVGRELAACGVTAVTDATPDKDATALQALADAVTRGALPQRVVAMGGLGLTEPEGAPIETGAVKIMLRERALADFDGLVETIRRAHAQARGAAFHCVTRAELVMAVGALRAAGVSACDRIEHASVAPPELTALVAELGVVVVTQPGFIYERGDIYLRDVDPVDRPWLYRGRGFLAEGVALGGATDAPYGEADPWCAIRAAVDRRTRGGATLGVQEKLTPERALGLFTSPLESPGTPRPPLGVGDEADLCLVDLPWRDFREQLSREHVVCTIARGEIIWRMP